MTQRPSKVPIHYKDKLNALQKELEKHNLIKQIGSSPHDKPTYGTTYLNPLVIIPKGDSIKCVLDARDPILTQMNLTNVGLLNLLLLNAETKSTNVQLISCTHMLIRPLDKETKNVEFFLRSQTSCFHTRLFWSQRSS